jgi:hypothetical protein
VTAPDPVPGPTPALPNAELVAKALLSDALSIPVYQTPPRTPPERYIRVARAGGVMRNRVTDAATMVISCYATDPADAADLANQARAALVAGRGHRAAGVLVRGWVEMGGPAYYPDPDRNDRVRYQFTGELRLAAHVN